MSKRRKQYGATLEQVQKRQQQVDQDVLLNKIPDLVVEQLLQFHPWPSSFFDGEKLAKDLCESIVAFGSAIGRSFTEAEQRILDQSRKTGVVEDGHKFTLRHRCNGKSFATQCLKAQSYLDALMAKTVAELVEGGATVKVVGDELIVSGTFDAKLLNSEVLDQMAEELLEGRGLFHTMAERKGFGSGKWSVGPTQTIPLHDPLLGLTQSDHCKHGTPFRYACRICDSEFPVPDMNHVDLASLELRYLHDIDCQREFEKWMYGDFLKEDPKV